MPYKETSNIGKLFVYLMHDEHPVCYWKGSILDFINPNPTMKWYPFTNDLAVGKVKEAHMGGLFQMKVSLNNPSQNGILDFKS